LCLLWAVLPEINLWWWWWWFPTTGLQPSTASWSLHFNFFFTIFRFFGF